VKVPAAEHDRVILEISQRRLRPRRATFTSEIGDPTKKRGGSLAVWWRSMRESVRE
jgi:hypothetical protein